MEIKEAHFVISNTNPERCPPPKYPEYAFIGRSNVGKSSIINMLCNNKKLAKISSTPGKTQLINHYLINKSWFLVDLPGYGYAKASKTIKFGLTKIIASYLKKRTNLQTLFILIDCRIEPLDIDLTFLREIGDVGIPFSIIFTKFDKLNKTEQGLKIEHYLSVLKNDFDELPPIFITSSVTKAGREEVLDYIEEINQSWKLVDQS